MKKRIVAALAVICVICALVPVLSHAAAAVYFIAINDEILDFNTETMPYIIGNDVFVPAAVFNMSNDIDVWAIGSDDEQVVLLRFYNGTTQYLMFTTKPGKTSVVDQNDNTLDWPAARRFGGRYSLKSCAN